VRPALPCFRLIGDSSHHKRRIGESGDSKSMPKKVRKKDFADRFLGESQIFLINFHLFQQK